MSAWWELYVASSFDCKWHPTASLDCKWHPPTHPSLPRGPQTVRKASKAAFGLCSWVRAMEAYDRLEGVALVVMSVIA